MLLITIGKSIGIIVMSASISLGIYYIGQKVTNMVDILALWGSPVCWGVFGGIEGVGKSK